MSCSSSTSLHSPHQNISRRQRKPCLRNSSRPETVPPVVHDDFQRQQAKKSENFLIFSRIAPESRFYIQDQFAFRQKNAIKNFNLFMPNTSLSQTGAPSPNIITHIKSKHNKSCHLLPAPALFAPTLMWKSRWEHGELWAEPRFKAPAELQRL